MPAATPHDATLHILNKAPGHPRFAACLQQLTDGDGLVLLEDAVVACRQPELAAATGSIALFVMQADAEARGLTPPEAGEETTMRWCHMADLVALTEAHPRITNW